MPFFDPIRIGASGAVATAYSIDRSLRFQEGNSDYLDRTPSSQGDRRVFTLSWWMKLGKPAFQTSTFTIFSAQRSTLNPSLEIRLQENRLVIVGNKDGSSGSYMFSLVTDQMFRDPSAWYHFVVAFKTSDSTSSNRIKIYVNGSQVTDFDAGGTGLSANTYPSTDDQTSWGTNEAIQQIGRKFGGSAYFDGYLAEINVVDGSQLTPSSFGETDSITGQWIPKKYTGSYGNSDNGYYLNFSDNSSVSALGTDSSGNSNNFTPNNFSVSADTGNSSVTDTPTNNFPVWHPLYAVQQTGGPTVYTYANLRLATNTNAPTSGQYYPFGFTSFGATSGKWYAEVRVSSSGAAVGIANNGQLDSDVTSNPYGAYASTSFIWTNTGEIRTNDGNLTGQASYTSGDIIGIAMDLDNLKLYMHKNGTYINSGNPSSGSNGYTIGSLPSNRSGEYVFSAGSNGASNALYYINLGQIKITGTTYSDAGGIGTFNYTVPTGFKALCSANLPDPTILLPNEHFEAEIWTGTGSQRAITGYDFAPDWVWVKRRSNSGYHILANTLSGANNYMVSNTNSSESVGGGSQLINGFNSDGFDVGTEGAVNASSETYVGWCWNAGNTDGKTYTVTVVSDSGNKFRFDGYGTSAVTLDLAEGGTYIFNYPSGHPFRFSTTSDGTHGGGSEYTTGVTHNSSTQVTIVVAASAPTLYYYCSSHSGMGGQVNTNSTVGSSNFDGSIQSRVKVNASAGFSIINYTGTGADGTVGHGLGVTPSWVLVKNTDSDEHWTVKHKNLSSGYNLKLNLNENQGQSTGSTNGIIADLSSSSNFSLTRTGNTGNYDNVNLSGDNHFAVCFSEVEGYSKFGTYYGNFDADGPFIHTGFRPAWLMVKILDLDNWYMVDNKRDPYNVMDHRVFADSESAEGGIGQEHVDFCSNGFKWRRAKTPFNHTYNYVYFCFAESPFKNARAR